MSSSLLLTLFTLLFTTITASHHHRHLLHQPFFPLDSSSPSSSPLPQPQQQQPKLPFSTTPSIPQKPFFPSYHSPPPPSPNILATFPANISSLLFPNPSPSKPLPHKLIAIAVSVSLFSAALLAALAAFLLYHRRNSLSYQKPSAADALRLYPPNAVPSDGLNKSRAAATPNHSSEFLYLGTLVNSRGTDDDHASNSTNAGVSAPAYQKLGSPELRPLPPLPRFNFMQNLRNVSAEADHDDDEEDEEEEFFSPRGSSGRKESPSHTGSSSRRVLHTLDVDNFRHTSFNSPSSTNSASSTPSLPQNSSPTSLKSKSPDSNINFLAPSRAPPPPPKPRTPSASSLSSSDRDSGSTHNSPVRIYDVSVHSKQSPSRNQFVPKKLPPPPPPLPAPRFWEIPVVPRIMPEPIAGPPVLVTPSRPIVFNDLAPVSPVEVLEINEAIERSEETHKPKLKALHWDKVRASSDRAMVWDQIKSNSFQLNEEMIETLFTVNAANLTLRDNVRRQILPSLNQENRVLDPKKSQNIAILLRALNVTADEVCEALLEGNADSLGSELLESLMKMAPTKEEERKLKEFKDETPLKLGPAEKFLKAVLDIPFAFKRVDAMLYIANFESEVEYLTRSFEILETACAELRNSRMFLKLLEAVLKTGNRMNVGTNRGDAHAFKLDTLLKLVDVKGTDGKTTLLHFVLQEIIRTEGSRLSGTNEISVEDSQQSAFRDDVEFRKLGLQVVAGLSGELMSVKKAAAMDSDVLGSEVSKLARGITKIWEVVKLNEELPMAEGNQKFSESINGFLKTAENEIVRIEAQESVVLSLVKEITEYFHGNSAKEEAHPFRIFTVVRDFLCILDQACKEVGKINDRTIVGAAQQFQVVNPSTGPMFPGLNGRQQYGCSDDESSPPS